MEMRAIQLPNLSARAICSISYLTRSREGYQFLVLTPATATQSDGRYDKYINHSIASFELLLWIAKLNTVNDRTIFELHRIFVTINVF